MLFKLMKLPETMENRHCMTNYPKPGTKAKLSLGNTILKLQTECVLLADVYVWPAAVPVSVKW